MPWAAAATIVAAGIAADSSRSAANKQGSANDADLAERKRQYDLNREDNERWGMMKINGEETLYRETIARNADAMRNGNLAGNQLAYRMGLGGTGTGEADGLNKRYKDFQFEQDQGYQFRRDQGQTNVNNKMAASGNLLSGAAMKALTRFNQDYASNEVNNAYGRYNTDRAAYEGANMNEYNRLAGIQGAGQNATNAVSGIGSSSQTGINNALSGIASGNQAASNTYGNAFSQYQANAGNIGANQQMAYGKAWNQGLSGLANAWNSYQSQNGVNNPNNSNSYVNSGGYTYDQGF